MFEDLESRRDLNFMNWIYSITTPSFVRAVKRTPTGSERRADCNAMCSFPLPDAIESATSRPSNFPLSFFSKSFFS